MVKELENCKERKLISYDQITVTADLRLSLEINKNSIMNGFRFDEDEEEEVLLQTSFLQDIFKTVTYFLFNFDIVISIYFSSFVFYLSSFDISKQNLVMELGVHSSLYLNCHHQITYAKFNVKIHYPPHYEKANVDHIGRSINEFSWERCFVTI